MPAERLPIQDPYVALRRMELCTYAIQEIHIELQAPTDSDEKADLILATERLVGEIVDLYGTVRRYVWGEEEGEENGFFSQRDDEDSDDT